MPFMKKENDAVEELDAKIRSSESGELCHLGRCDRAFNAMAHPVPCQRKWWELGDALRLPDSERRRLVRRLYLTESVLPTYLGEWTHVTHLRLGPTCRRSLVNIPLPPTLVHLECGTHYNHPLPTPLPETLRCLDLGYVFDHDIEVYPPGLKHLALSDHFSPPMPMDDLQFPPGLGALGVEFGSRVFFVLVRGGYPEELASTYVYAKCAFCTYTCSADEYIPQCPHCQERGVCGIETCGWGCQGRSLAQCANPSILEAFLKAGNDGRSPCQIYMYTHEKFNFQCTRCDCPFQSSMYAMARSRSCLCPRCEASHTK